MFGESVIYEQIVSRRPRTKDTAIRVLLVLIAVAIAAVGSLFVGLVFVIVAIFVLFLFVYFLFPRLRVEYEYSLLDTKLIVCAVFNKEGRKKKMEADLSLAESIVAVRKDGEEKISADKIYDFTTGDPDARVVRILVPIDSVKSCIYFEPDEEMCDRIRKNIRGSYYGSVQI